MARKYRAIGRASFRKEQAQRDFEAEQSAIKRAFDAEENKKIRDQRSEDERLAREARSADAKLDRDSREKQAAITRINNAIISDNNRKMEQAKLAQRKAEHEATLAETKRANLEKEKANQTAIENALAETEKTKASTERIKAETEKLKLTGNIETKQAGITDDVIISIVEDPKIQYGNQQKGQGGWAFTDTVAAEKTLAHEYAESYLEYAKTQPSKYDKDTGEFKPGVEKEAKEEGYKYAKKDMENRIKKIKGAAILYIQSNPNATPDEVRRFIKKVGVDTFKPVPKTAER